ncbi:Protein of unknown function [Pyronema omphalodes CBS 100304]|uniref:Uncharacterized protein n=1 Tax=Pyronema omphalodes (strain CBS 100304) TaxID=1076935 RepID=U4L8D2_PYROM|nr:Protein of unknown function [Pyronema omphalodes CBS 100304]
MAVSRPGVEILLQPTFHLAFFRSTRCSHISMAVAFPERFDLPRNCGH